MVMLYRADLESLPSSSNEDTALYTANREINAHLLQYLEASLNEAHNIHQVNDSEYDYDTAVAAVISRYGYERTLAVLADMIKDAASKGVYSESLVSKASTLDDIPRSSPDRTDYITILLPVKIGNCFEAAWTQLIKAKTEEYKGVFITTRDALWTKLFFPNVNNEYENNVLRRFLHHTEGYDLMERIGDIKELIGDSTSKMTMLGNLLSEINSQTYSLERLSEALRISIIDVAEQLGHHTYARTSGDTLIISKGNPDVTLTVYADGVTRQTNRVDIDNAVDFVRHFPNSNGMTVTEAVDTILNTVQTQTTFLPHPDRTDKRDWVTPEQIEEAKSVSILTLAQARGFELKREGRGDEYRLVSDASVTLTGGKNLWNDFSIDHRKGGSTIDFMMHYPDRNQMSLPTAVREIHRLCLRPLDHYIAPPTRPRAITGMPDVQDKSNIEVTETRMNVVDEPPRRFIPPTNAGNARQAFGYLTGRGIDYDLIRDLARENRIYQSELNNNIVFMGFDSEGNPRNAHLRGTSSDPAKRFLQDYIGSSKSFCFAMPGNPNNRDLYVFEGPIDALSHATMSIMDGENWRSVSRLSLNGLTGASLWQYLADHRSINAVYLCLDNDDAGIRVTTELKSELESRHHGLQIHVVRPIGKDFNDDLVARRQAEKSIEKGKNLDPRM